MEKEVLERNWLTDCYNYTNGEAAVVVVGKGRKVVEGKRSDKLHMAYKSIEI